MAKVTFETLNHNAALFYELKGGNYTWWENIKKDPRLYIEIRKDNNINVYYEGGSVVKLHCSKNKKIQAFTHRKYLLGDGVGYKECSLDNDLETIIKNIPDKYSGKKGYEKENWSEKYIQSQYIIKYHSDYIDSEFAYKDNLFDIRVDLIKCINGELRFVELKRLDDNRMLKINDDNPEVVEQVKAYTEFIHKYKKEIIEYYKKIWSIKNELGLINTEKCPSSLAEKPLLLIFDRWTHSTSKRINHTQRLKEILDREKIDYVINEDI